MSLLTYTEQLSSLKTAKMAGLKAPHKPILLLSVIDLIERDVIVTNHIALSEELERQFAYNWVRYVGPSVIFHAKIATPFWHLSNEPFWRLTSFSGETLTKDNFQGGKYSVVNLREQVAYAEIDKELFEMLQDKEVRAKIRVLMISTYLTKTHIQQDDMLSILMTIGIVILPVAS